MHFLSADRELARLSYYADTAQREASYPTLQGDADCDVAVVGGGLAGLSAAIALADKGFSVRLLEAQQVGFGASGRNGGQAIHGLACEQGEIERQLGMAEARHVFDKSVEALDLIRAVAGLGVIIHEHSAATAITLAASPTVNAGARTVLHTARGRLSARQVLLAGNTYLQGLAPQLSDRTMPVSTYIVASKPLDADLARQLIPCGAAVCDNNLVLDYFRLSADHRMLFGGRVSYSTVTPGNSARSLRQRMTQSFPQLSTTAISHAWGGFVDITINRAPDFGRLPDAQQVYCLQGFPDTAWH